MAFNNKKKAFELFVREKGSRNFVVYCRDLESKQIDYNKSIDAVSKKQADYLRDKKARELTIKGYKVTNDKNIYF